MISRPNQTHMKQSDLGKSLDPIPHQNVLTISASDLKRRVLDYACLNWRSLVKQKDWKHALQVRAIQLFMLLRQPVCPPPHQKGGGTQLHTRRAARGVGGNILEEVSHWIGLLQYNLSTYWPIICRRGREKTHSIRTDNLEARQFVFFFVKGLASQNQQKTILLRLITSRTYRTTFTGQSHFRLIFVLTP
jgi:hypothetical protein